MPASNRKISLQQLQQMYSQPKSPGSVQSSLPRRITLSNLNDLEAASKMNVVFTVS